jgi:CheY-like chemotaxis protein
VLDGGLGVGLAECAEKLPREDGILTPLAVVVWSPGAQAVPIVPRSDGLTVRQAQSRERLIDFISFALHLPLDRLPVQHRLMLEAIHGSSAALTSKKVLIVDDDVRNIFALATVLEDHGMDVVSAGSGREALKLMQEQRGLDIVLMDIMMPDMDGMATIRAAREIPFCQALPNIAYTAKALKGDRERCIEAGAWDYLAKPVDANNLLSVMRSWLYR